MSSKKRNQITKKLREKIPSYSLKELYDMKVLPENYHLKEYWEYNKYATNTEFWKRI